MIGTGLTRARPQRPRDAHGALRIALSCYRGNPHSGGQGVYIRHLSRELVLLGHHVTVFSGQPYPDLDAGVELVRLASLDLYREPDPFRRPRWRELGDVVDLLELVTMWTGGFPEPRTFSLRLARVLAARTGQFDLLHDDQGLGTGILRLRRAGWPIVASVHHPVTIDRALDLRHERRWAKRLSLRRWYGFARMQTRVARELEDVLTVSATARRDIIEQMGLRPETVKVVPVGVDPSVYRPRPEISRVPGRVMTTASADVPLKGLAILLGALTKVRVEHPEVHLVVVGRLRPASPIHALLERNGLRDVVAFVNGESDEQLARRYAEACCAVVPSLYEGFSLPAVEALASGAPLIATTGGALGEVVGEHGRHALLVPPGDVDALAQALGVLLEDPVRAAALAERGRARALERFSWRQTAVQTVAVYREILERQRFAQAKRMGQLAC